MWIEWAADMLGLLGVLMIWAVLLPENSAQWRIILFGKMNLPVRWLQTGGSLLIVGALFAIMEWATFYPQPRLVLLLLLLIAVFAFLFRGFPLSFTIMHTFFAVTVTEYFQILFRCFVPWEWNDFFEMILVNGSACLCVFLLCWIIRRRHLAVLYYEHRQMCWVMTGVLGIPVLVLAQFLQNEQTDTSLTLPGLFMLLHFLMLCLFVGMLIFFRGRQESQKIAANDRYIQSMEAYVDSARVRAHDYNKHLNYLHDLVMTEKDPEKLRQEVQVYYQDLQIENQLNDILLHMENPLFRALLYGQANQAQKQGIQLKISATPRLPEFPLPEYRLVEIFQNLMDNAMDAVRHLEPERRYIGVRLSCEGENGRTTHRLVIENPIPDQMPSIVQMTQKNFTTKGEHHQGLGLYQVSKLVNKYDGDLMLEDQDGMIRVEVTFYSKEAREADE